MFTPGDIVRTTPELATMWKDHGAKHALSPRDANMLVLKVYPIYDHSGDSVLSELEVMFNREVWTISSRHVIKLGEEL